MDQFSETINDSGVIDITTTGAKSGMARRIEINFLHLDGRYFITGRPGRKRDWQANLKANPHFVIHLKGSEPHDLEAKARLVDDDDERSEVLYRILVEGWGNEPSKAEHILPRWVEGSPLVEFTLN